MLELATDEELFELENILFGPRRVSLLSRKNLHFFGVILL